MLFDNPTLFNVLLVQALAAALLFLALSGWRSGPATRWAQACMGANALGWLLIEASVNQPELARGLQTLAMVAFSASLSALWWALQLWLLRRRGLWLMAAAPVLLGLGYGIHFHDSVSFRLAWSQAWLGLQCLMLTLSLALPRPPQELHPDMSATAAELQPSSVSLRWRALLLSAIVPIGLICLLRAALTAVGLQDASSLANLHLAGAANSLLGLTVHWSLTAGLLGLVLAWRGEAEAELARLAQTDSLTGLADARAFAARSVALISMARRHQEPLALVLLDLDHLKAINASHGNEGGDRALALFGSCIQAQMRLGDLAGRIGPEEFGVLMARCDAQGPEALDARLRTALAQRAPAELGFELAYSGGWAKLRHGDRDIEDLKRRAETALYEAKRGGRAHLQAEPGLQD
ncbi:GGDEF domain-containing protein [Paucibacter sp. DJ2R-2]|uniref:GGDEF domain-containing protein n=1 Tax=Paucibacter sp. DJ2R-2 TaxID=2893558 RepID=UPI0021E382A1|nr:GGDEF domain-containing protein [Paucibacter sp. DJ2R-2]MCV2422070.1 GGDEF domain-containing protein [Paucibacter sp. DJ4R-1]MCV2439313.1 GGDEF domain-containing protein [Paucibacter sp. DJ2R-2]